MRENINIKQCSNPHMLKHEFCTVASHDAYENKSRDNSKNVLLVMSKGSKCNRVIFQLQYFQQTLKRQAKRKRTL